MPKPWWAGQNIGNPFGGGWLSRPNNNPTAPSLPPAPNTANTGTVNPNGSQIQGAGGPVAGTGVDPNAFDPGGSFGGGTASPPPVAGGVGDPNAGKPGFDPAGLSLFYDPAKWGSKATDQYRAYVDAGGKLNFADFMSAYSAAQQAGLGFQGSGSGGVLSDPNSAPGDISLSNDFIEFLRSIGLNIGGVGQVPQDPNNTFNRFEQAGGLFGGNLFGTGDTDASASLIANILAGEQGRQAGRSGEQEALLRDLVLQGQGSSANLANEAALAGAQQLADPAALQALQAKLENQARATAAGGENASMNRLRDLGVFGQGAAGAGAVNQASNLANQRLMQGLTDIGFGIEGLQRERLGQAGQMAAQGADTFRGLNVNPQLQLADRLGRAFNPATGSLTDFLAQMMNLRNQHAIAAGTGSNFFEQASPLLGGLIGAAGDVLSAPKGISEDLLSKLLG